MVSGRRGAAIPFALLFSLALYALAWGVFLSSASAVRAARAAVTLSELTSVAHSRIGGEFLRGPGALADTVLVGRSRARVDSTTARRWRADWTRLGREAWLVRVTAWPGPSDTPGPPLTASRLAWVLDPATRVARLADITVGDSARVTMVGPAPGLAVEVVDSIRLGLLDVDQVSSGMPTLSGVVSPRVVTRSGVCDLTVLENLGDPLGVSACRDEVGVRRVETSVEVRGGSGHVLLGGQGDIALTDGAYLRGMLLTTGSVRILDGTFEGLIVAMGGLEVLAGGTFVPDRPYAQAAIAAFLDQRPGAELLHPARNLGGD